MSLDHGQLSIPNRTRNINRDLDRYKREKKKADRAEAKRLHQIGKQARALLAQYEENILSAYSHKYDRKELRSCLRGMPAQRLIKFIELFIAGRNKSNSSETPNSSVVRV